MGLTTFFVNQSPMPENTPVMAFHASVNGLVMMFSTPENASWMLVLMPPMPSEPTLASCSSRPFLRPSR